LADSFGVVSIQESALDCQGKSDNEILDNIQPLMLWVGMN
jgi:hypothetical protein